MLKKNNKNGPLVVIIIGILYFTAGKLSLSFAFLNASVSAIWIPTAVSITAFIFYGYKIWPAIFLGSFLVNITTAGTVLTSAGISCGNTLEGVAALFLINKFLDKQNLYGSPITLIKYSLLVGLISTAISAVIGILVLTAAGMIRPGNYSLVFLAWWIGDMGSAIIFASIILLWKENEIKWSTKKIFEAAAVLIILVITTIIIFIPKVIYINLPMIINRYPFPLFTFPLFLYVAFRFGLRETTAAIVIFFSIAVAGISMGSERMAAGTPEASFINLQIFTMIIFLLKMSVSTAVNQRRKFERNLRLSEEKFRKVTETATDAIITIDSSSCILFCNKSVERIFGYRPSELIGKDLKILMPGRLKERHSKAMQQYLMTGKKTITWSSFETTAWHKREFEVPIELSFSEITQNGSKNFTAIIRDITDRKNVRMKMERTIKEKEILLREIHHRVKNNLQVISSLLSLQSGRVKDKEALEILKISRDRIRSMALIHEKLYKSEEVVNINIREYLQELISYLYSSYNIDLNEIKLNLDVKETNLELETLIPVSLIVNELISNALKHGFPEYQDNAEISLKLGGEGNRYILEISNNGKEFPEDIDFRNTESLGLQLVNTLSEQINGSLTLVKDGKTTFILNFNT